MKVTRYIIRRDDTETYLQSYRRIYKWTKKIQKAALYNKNEASDGLFG